MSPRPRTTHDILLTVGSTETGLLLIKGEDGAPLFRITDISGFSPKTSEGEAKYTDEPPEQQIPMVQTSWHAGFGAYEFESQDPMRYAYAEGIDARFKGQMILGPKMNFYGFGPSQSTFPFEYPSYFASDSAHFYMAMSSRIYKFDYTKMYWLPHGTIIENCEDAWNEQVVAGVTASASTTSIAGTYSAKFAMTADAVVGVIGSKLITSLTLAQFADIQCWVRCSVATNAGDFQLLLDDTANCASPLETRSFGALVANTWTLQTLGLAAPAGDTAIISVGIKMAVDKGACDFYIDHVVARIELGSTATDLKKYKSYIYAASGDSAEYWYFNSTVATKSTLTGGFAHKFEVVPSDTDFQLWKVLSVGELKSSTNPVNGGIWSGVQAQIGDSSDTVRNLMVLRGVLLGLMEKACYSFDNNGRQRKLFDAPQGPYSQWSAFYNRATYNHLGRGYLATSDMGLLEYDFGAPLQGVHPQIFGPKISQGRGYVGAITGDHSWVYFAFEGGPIWAARYEVINDATRWVMHPLTDSSTYGYSCYGMAVHIYSSTRYLHFAYVDVGGGVYKTGIIILPKLHDNPVMDTSGVYRYASTGLGVRPWWDAGLPDRDKWFTRTKEWVEGVDATHTVKLEYQLDLDSAPWVTVATWNSGSDGQRVGTLNVSGKRIRFRDTLTASNNLDSPIVRNFVAYARPHTQRLALIQFTVKAASGLRMLSGRQDPLSVATLKGRLEAARDSTTGFTLSRRISPQADIESWVVSVLPGGFQEVEVYDHDKKGKVLAYSITALEAKVS